MAAGQERLSERRSRVRRTGSDLERLSAVLWVGFRLSAYYRFGLDLIAKSVHCLFGVQLWWLQVQFWLRSSCRHEHISRESTPSNAFLSLRLLKR